MALVIARLDPPNKSEDAIQVFWIPRIKRGMTKERKKSRFTNIRDADPCTLLSYGNWWILVTIQVVIIRLGRMIQENAANLWIESSDLFGGSSRAMTNNVGNGQIPTT